MKQIIIIKWWDCFPTQELFYKALRERDYNTFSTKKKRRDWIADKTQENYQTIIPNMPNDRNADYEAWKIWFERHFPFLSQEETILIGWSLWWSFLAKRLSENKFPKQIQQLHLVAPCFDNEDFEEESIGNFQSNPNYLKNIPPQVNEIFLYHSKDDTIVSFSHHENFKKYLPNAKTEIFEDRGHFIQETFPELLENIIR